MLSSSVTTASELIAAKERTSPLPSFRSAFERGERTIEPAQVASNLDTDRFGVELLKLAGRRGVANAPVHRLANMLSQAFAPHRRHWRSASVTAIGRG